MMDQKRKRRVLAGENVLWETATDQWQTWFAEIWDSILLLSTVMTIKQPAYWLGRTRGTMSG